jgi:hypothetical protein
MPFFVVPDSWGTYGIRKVSRSLKRAARTGSRLPIRARGRSGILYKFKELNLYEEELRKYLNTSSGDLWKYLEIKGDLAVAGARAMVGVKTGRLKASIHKKHLGNITGQYLWIGSNIHYAYAHHEGTKPHIIRPKNDKKLVFRGKNRVLVHTQIVRHPGTRPNPYLRAQLYHFAG